MVDASDNSSKSVSFSIDTNATGDLVYPLQQMVSLIQHFFSPSYQRLSLQVVSLLVSINYYGTYAESQNGYSPGFDGGAPDLIVEAPPATGERATVSATVSGGAITAITIESGGSGYDSSDLPSVSIVGGPHLLKVSMLIVNIMDGFFSFQITIVHGLPLMILDWKVVKPFRQFLLQALLLRLCVLQH